MARRRVEEQGGEEEEEREVGENDMQLVDSTEIMSGEGGTDDEEELRAMLEQTLQSLPSDVQRAQYRQLAAQACAPNEDVLQCHFSGEANDHRLVWEWAGQRYHLWVHSALGECVSWSFSLLFGAESEEALGRIAYGDEGLRFEPVAGNERVMEVLREALRRNNVEIISPQDD